MRRKRGQTFPLGSSQDLTNRFTYHAPGDEHRARHEELRAEILSMALLLVELVPASREQSLVLTKLEECSFWAHAAIARQEIA